MMNRIELKQEAKGVVRTAAVSAYLFALLYLALTELLQGASVYVNGDVALYMQTYFPNVPIPSYLYPVALPTTVVTPSVRETHWAVSMSATLNTWVTAALARKVPCRSPYSAFS